MTSHEEILLALRARLVTLSAVTTGATDLSATSTGYARAAGSFLTDGFAEGMEVTPTGFTQTATGVVAANITALALPITGGRTVQAVGAGRSIACLLPTARAWENRHFVPVAGAPWVEEDYLPGPVAQVTVGPLGDVETLPQYVVKLYGLPKTGTGALYRLADALLLLFPPRLAITLTSGDVLRVCGGRNSAGESAGPAPYRSQLMQDAAGFAVVVVTIPLRVRSRNTI